MKKLDPSVTWSNKWAKYRVIDNRGSLIEFELKPSLVMPNETINGGHSLCQHGWHECTYGWKSYISDGWDTTNWQQSLEKRNEMKKLNKDTPWKNNWASHRAVNRNGLLYEFNVKPKYNCVNGNWCISTIDVLQSYDFIDNSYEFTPEPQFRVKEVGEIIKPTTPDYHTLPCGTKIPPEGVIAWVKGEVWSTEPMPVIAYARDKYITVNQGSLVYYKEYSLTDPHAKPEPKKRKITPKELLGKWVHRSETNIKLVSGIEDNMLICGRFQYAIEIVLKECKGYSDTPISEVKSFWVEEV